MIDDKIVEIMIPGLQSKFTENGCRMSDDRAGADYVLTVEANNCNVSQAGSFFYSYACVKADIVNAKTGKNEAKLNFTGPKTGWTTAERANRKAFEDAVNALWKDISSKTEVCR
jgi:hypothetical protein